MRGRRGVILTLWDLLKPAAPKPAATKAQPRARPRQPKRRAGMQDAYDALVQEMLQQHGLRVRRWRTSSSGVAILTRAHNGTERRWIESPYPKGPMSCAIFLHEVGHHVIGLGRYSPRCLEEYHAWKWSLDTMEAKGLNVTDAVRRRVHRSLKYAVDKARRRGLKQIPPELTPYLKALA